MLVAARGVLVSVASLPTTPWTRRARVRRSHIGAALAIGMVAAMTAGLTVHPAYALTTAQDVVVSANPENDTPHVLDGRVSAIAVVGGKVILGGRFTQAQNWQAGSPVLARSNILAYD